MTRLTTAVEDYFTELRRVRATGGATGEQSSYGPLANLLNAVGATLKPMRNASFPTPTARQSGYADPKAKG